MQLRNKLRASGLLLLSRHFLVSKAGLIEAEMPLFPFLITFSFHLILAIGFTYSDNHIGSEIHLSSSEKYMYPQYMMESSI